MWAIPAAAPFTQSGGTNTAQRSSTWADNAGSSGAYNLSGGSLAATTLHVGNYGSGSFTQSGGSNTVS